MSLKKKNYCLPKLCFIILLIIVILGLPAVSFSLEKSKKLTANYPEGLSGQGCIDSISAKTVVIDDAAFKFAANVTFYKLQSQNASRSLFRQGIWVGYITNSQKQIESLWYLKPCE